MDGRSYSMGHGEPLEEQFRVAEEGRRLRIMWQAQQERDATTKLWIARATAKALNRQK